MPYTIIYFDISIGWFMSAWCMSWMSAICVLMQLGTLFASFNMHIFFHLFPMRIVSFIAFFRVVTEHSSLCNAPLCGEGFA